MLPGLSRRQFLRAGLAGAAALTVIGCGDPSHEEESLEGFLPIKYGDAPAQVADLLVPNEVGPHPVLVYFHGGWWEDGGFNRRSMRAIAQDASEAGYAAWNVEYRVVGEDGAGFPGTLEDVVASLGKLAEIAPQYNLDLNRVVFVGHSVGGQLALWAASRADAADGELGADIPVLPVAVISQAAVFDLVGAAGADWGGSPVVNFLGGTPIDVPDRYNSASPIALLPFGIPHLVVHGDLDEIVPVDESRRFVDLARASGDFVEYLELPGVDHFDLIDPKSDAWVQVRDRLDALVAPAAVDPAAGDGAGS